MNTVERAFLHFLQEQEGFIEEQLAALTLFLNTTQQQIRQNRELLERVRDLIITLENIQ